MARKRKSKPMQIFSRLVMFVLLFAILSIIKSIFGQDNFIVSLYKENVLFTPYNIVGMIMIPLALSGVWIGRKKGRIIYKIVSGVLTISAVLPWIKTFISFFNFDENIGTEPEPKITWLKVMSFIIWSIVIVTLVVLFVKLIIDPIKEKMYSRKNTQDDNSVDKEDKRCNTASVSDVATLNSTIEINRKENSIESFSENKYWHIARERKVKVNKQKNNDLNTSTLLIDGQNKICNRTNVADITYSHKIYEVAYKICPLCGGELWSRQNHKTKECFMGCENYFSKQHCTFTISYREFKQIEQEIFEKNFINNKKVNGETL